MGREEALDATPPSHEKLINQEPDKAELARLDEIKKKREIIKASGSSETFDLSIFRTPFSVLNNYNYFCNILFKSPGIKSSTHLCSPGI